MEAQLITVEVQKSTESALAVINDAKSLIIVIKEDYELGQLLMSDIKSRILLLKTTRLGQTRPLDESKQKIMDFFSGPLQKLEDAKNYLSQIMVKWAEEEERKRLEKEKQLQEEARKRAEEEALKEALEAEAVGEKQIAEEIIRTPVYVAPVKVVSEIPKSKQSHIRTTWSAEGFDLMATVKAIVEGKAPLQSVKYDMVFLNSQATDYNLALNIPGVRAISKKTQL